MATKKILIGRDDSNNVVIAEVSVSRIHAELIDSGKNLHIKDLDSKNSTFILRDGIHVVVGSEPVEILLGDLLSFGLVGPYKLQELIAGFERKVILIAHERPKTEERESKTNTAVVKPAKYRCPSCGSIVKNTLKICDNCHTHL